MALFPTAIFAQDVGSAEQPQPPTPATERPAIPTRYEMGQRVRRLERRIEAESRSNSDWTGLDSAAPVLPYLEAAVQAFFRMDPRAVVHAIDSGYAYMLNSVWTPLRPGANGPRRHSLPASAASDLQRSIQSGFECPRILTDQAATTLRIAWPALYETPLLAMGIYENPLPATGESARPSQAPTKPGTEDRLWTWSLQPLASADPGADVHRESFESQALFREVAWPKAFPPGDYQAQLVETVADQEIEVGRRIVSWIPDGATELKALQQQIQGAKELGPHQKATLDFHDKLLHAVLHGPEYETDLPAHRLLQEAQSLLQAEDLPRWLAERSGEFWIALRGEQNGVPKGTAHLRILSPPITKAGERRPCVLALHGAGGSENMFFDSYGAGKIVELCRQRGWVLIAPRAGFTGIGIPFADVWDTLADPLAIDRSKIMIVGHSMGVSTSMAALREADRTQGFTYRACAAIAGGGKPHLSQPIFTRFLIVTGSHDFLKASARKLHNRLIELGTQPGYEELKNVEHMGAVQFGLPKVFAFFDRVVGS